MARKSTRTNHKKLDDNAYSDKYNEKISYLSKDKTKFEHEIDSIARYIGGMHTKGSLCKITKQVESKSKLYYSVIFEGTDREVNWIMAHLLVKVGNESNNENINENEVENNINSIEEENINEN